TGDRSSQMAGRRLGAATAAGVFLAFAMTPLATAPAARADGALDLFFGLVDPGWSTQGLDPGDLPADLPQFIDLFIYSPMHTAVEDWIHSDLGMAVDGFINDTLGNGQLLIGDGAPGIAGGTLAEAAGGDGGLWFGDGG